MRFGIVDFFSGCGGASIGFSSVSLPGASVEIVAGVDIDRHACATFTRNLGKPAHCLDIYEVMEDPQTWDRLVEEWDLARFDKLILIGCAPCQGFAAHRKSIDGTDPRRHLFVLFTEIAVRLNPDAIFMENVPDMFSKMHWRHYLAGRKVLEHAKYVLRSGIYNFAGFGLPQERFRAVMLAMKADFEMPDAPIVPSQFKTVRETIAHLPPLAPGESCRADPMHRTSAHRKSTVQILSKVPPDGGNRPVGVGPKCLDRARTEHGGYTDVYGRLAWDRPSVTITARCRTPSCGRFAHPEQDRGLSIREAALLQGFPPTFIFDGNFDDRFKQIGNAVPPMVAAQFCTYLIQTIMGVEPSLKKSSNNDIEKAIGPGFAVTINGIKQRRIRQKQETLFEA